jgi:hypothetical protein
LRTEPLAARDTEFSGDRFEEVEGRKASSPHLFFAGLLLLAFVVRVLMGRRIVGPWYVFDEFLYAERAKQAADGTLFVAFPNIHPGFYPRLISPAWLLDSPGTAYAVAKTMNAAFMTLAFVPLYIWAKRFLRPWYAVLGVGLGLLLPALLYSGLLVTENAFFPLFVLAAFILALALERPTVLRQALVLAAIGAACVIRTQGVVLLAVVPTAIFLYALLEHRRAEAEPASFVARLRPFLPLGVAYAVVGGGYLLVRVAQGALDDDLGPYEGIVQGDYSVRSVGHWVAYHAAELGLLVVGIPLSALILLLVLGLGKRTPLTRSEAAFLAVTVAASFWIVIQVGTYTSRFALRLEERNQFHVAPLLLLALALWLQRGLPRPAGATALAAVAPIALLLTLPMEGLLNISLLSDTFSLIPFWELSLRSGPDPRTALAVGAIIAGLLFATVPRRLGLVVVPAALALYLVVVSLVALNSIADYARQFRVEAGAGDDVAWIDRRVGTEARVAIVHTPDPQPDRTGSIHIQTEFWNRSVRKTYKLAPINLCCIPQEDATLSPDGVVTPTSGAEPSYGYGVIERRSELAGERLAETSAFALYRLDSPLRVAGRTEGVWADGWMGSDASYTRYWTRNGRGGRVRIRLSRQGWGGPHVPGTVTVRVRSLDNNRVVRKLSARAPRRVLTISVRAPRPPFRVEVHVDATFTPAHFGLGDARALGGQLVFAFAGSPS